MKNKPILIVAGEPNSIFLEIFFKSLKLKNIKSPIILIVSLKTFLVQMKYLRFNYKYILHDYKNLEINKIKKNIINIINVDYDSKKIFEKISKKSKKYIENCFDVALQIIKSGITNKFINGPISKKNFLDKKYLGITEYLAEKTQTKNYAMLIYNEKLSVSPITTHLPLSLVSRKISKNSIINKIKLIDNFYRDILKRKPKIAIAGMNPHCESIKSYNEDSEILLPCVKNLRKKINIIGPLSADTLFLKDNRKKYDIIIGMYHDQVLTPIKTLFEFNAINITMGLPFLRVTPDHGPNEAMFHKNISNPKSLIEALKFLDKYAA